MVKLVHKMLGNFRTDFLLSLPDLRVVSMAYAKEDWERYRAIMKHAGGYFMRLQKHCLDNNAMPADYEEFIKLVPLVPIIQEEFSAMDIVFGFYIKKRKVIPLA